MFFEKIHDQASRKPSVARAIRPGDILVITEGYVGTGFWIIKREVAKPEVLRRLDESKAKGWSLKTMDKEPRVLEIMQRQAEHYTDPDKTEFVPTHSDGDHVVMARPDDGTVALNRDFYEYLTCKLQLKIVLGMGEYSPQSLYKNGELVGVVMPQLISSLELEGVA